ncbi:MAG: hypothetical protein ACOCWO_02960, partial [Candidatus Muiribacteriaceae bacterium]
MFGKKRENRKMVTNNGEMVLKGRKRMPLMVLLLVAFLSVGVFFLYSDLIMAEDGFDDFFDDLEDVDSDADSGSFDDEDFSSDPAAPNGSEEEDNCDMSPAMISQFEVAEAIKVQYFTDDPSDDGNHKDPFKPLIIKKLKRKKIITDTDQPEVKQEVIPPLDLKLVGIISAGDRKLAMITLDNKYLELFEGDEDPQGKFAVKT